MPTRSEMLDHIEECTHCANCGMDLLVCNAYMADVPFCDSFCAEQYKRKNADKPSVVSRRDEMLELASPEKRDSVELKMDAKGKQYWIIKLYFDRSTEDDDAVVDELNRIDTLMRNKFKNKAD